MGNDIVDLASPYVVGKSSDRKFIQRVLTAEEQTHIQASARPDALLSVYWAAKETAFKTIQKSDPSVSSAPRRYRVFLEASGIDALTPEASRGPRSGVCAYDMERFGGNISEGAIFGGLVTTPLAVVHILVHQNEEFIHCIGTTSRIVQKNTGCRLGGRHDEVYGFGISSDGVGLVRNIVPGVEKITGPVPPDFCRSSNFESRLVRRSARQKMADILSIKADSIRFIKRPEAQGCSVIPEVQINFKKAGIDISFSHDGRFVAYAFLFDSEAGVFTSER